MRALFFILILLASFDLTAQKKIIEEQIKYKQLYKVCTAMNDYSTAKLACYNLIELEGEMSAFKDSLALLFFKENNFEGCYFLSNDLLKNKPTDFALELNALSLFELKKYKASASQLEQLLAANKRKSIALRLAFCQWKTINFTEALSTIDYAFALHWDDIENITINLDGNETTASLNDWLYFLRCSIHASANNLEDYTKYRSLLKNPNLLQLIENPLTLQSEPNGKQ